MSLLDTDGRRLLGALTAVLVQKGIVAPDEIAAQIASTDKASPAIGAAMVARAWTDPAFRTLLLADGTQAAARFGIAMRGTSLLGVLDNTRGMHHLVVCTLCSCYPRAVLGYPPFWFKSPAYRARAVRDPRGVLAEWGTVLPAGTPVRVVDSTADYRWMVLPTRPRGTEDWDEAALAALVSEGDMIGVTVPDASRAPRVAGDAAQGE